MPVRVLPAKQILVVVIQLVALASAMGQSRTPARVFQNADAVVQRIILPPKQTLTISRDKPHFIVALSDGTLTLNAGSQSRAVSAPNDSIQFLPIGEDAVTNSGAAGFDALLIEISRPSMAAERCTCKNTNAEVNAICACGGIAPTTGHGAVIGKLTIDPFLLLPGGIIDQASESNPTLLIALSDLTIKDVHNLADESDWRASKPTLRRVRRGRVSLIPRGTHEFTNTGSQPARFVLLEF